MKECSVNGKLSKRAFDSDKRYVGASTIIRYFGSWGKALEAAGLESQNGRPVKIEPHSFIDKASWKCLLGAQAKNIEVGHKYAKWEVSGKTNLVIFSEKYNLDKFRPFKFHYFSENKVTELKEKYEVRTSKIHSVCFELEKVLDIDGRKFKNIRTRINRCVGLGLELNRDFKKLEDIDEFFTTWRAEYSDKYFWDFSGKNKMFYKNGWHKDLNNIFIYNGDKLVAVGSYSDYSYAIGKALYNEISGLSEFLDYSLYVDAYNRGIKVLNLGMSSNKRLLEYKKKFNGAFELIEYSGEVK